MSQTDIIHLTGVDLPDPRKHKYKFAIIKLKKKRGKKAKYALKFSFGKEWVSVNTPGSNLTARFLRLEFDKPRKNSKKTKKTQRKMGMYGYDIKELGEGLFNNNKNSNNNNNSNNDNNDNDKKRDRIECNVVWGEGAMAVEMSAEELMELSEEPFPNYLVQIYEKKADNKMHVNCYLLNELLKFFLAKMDGEIYNFPVFKRLIYPENNALDTKVFDQIYEDFDLTNTYMPDYMNRYMKGWYRLFVIESKKFILEENKEELDIGVKPDDSKLMKTYTLKVFGGNNPSAEEEKKIFMVFRDLLLNYKDKKLKELINEFGLQHIIKGLRDYHICKYAVQRNPNNLQHVPSNLKDLEMCKLALKRSALKFVPDNIFEQLWNERKYRNSLGSGLD